MQLNISNLHVNVIYYYHCCCFHHYYYYYYYYYYFINKIKIIIYYYYYCCCCCFCGLFIFIKDIFPDKATERKILSFTIKCCSNDCDWTGELRGKEVNLMCYHAT